MVAMNYLVATSALPSTIPATIPVAANDASVSFSDYAGTLTQDATMSRITRPIALSGFEHCAPGARARFNVTVTESSNVIVIMNYTGLVTRTDVYNDVGTILVNGSQHVDYINPNPKVVATPPPTGTANVSITLGAGTHTIEVIFPYSASVDFGGLLMPLGGVLSAAPARPTKKIVMFGDSITHGFDATKIAAHWSFLLAEAEGAQLLNLGFGGRQLVPADATIAASYGADLGLSLIGFNNFHPGTGSQAGQQAADESLQANWYAGTPGTPLYVLTPTWSSSDAGGGGLYDGNVPTLEQFRQSRRDAVAARADPTTTLIEGATGSMPTGLVNFPDGIHPNDAASATISTVLSAAII